MDKEAIKKELVDGSNEVLSKYGEKEILDSVSVMNNTPLFLPRKSHGQRSLAGCKPWRPSKKLDLAAKGALSGINHMPRT